LGKTWQDSTGSPKFAEGSDKSVAKLWRIQPAGDSEPGVLHCGADPACLFRSEDGGETWTENEALTNHPTREGWFPGAGGLITHSIVIDPTNQDRMWLAISAAGVFRTQDRGNSWQPMNSNLKNVLAKYDPNAEKCRRWVRHHLGTPRAGGRLTPNALGHLSQRRGASPGPITEGLPSASA
jgi:hypothetical protein